MRPRYTVQIARAALRQFESLPRQVQERLRPHIRGLGENPRPEGSQKLVGTDDYRIRVGAYRVIYEVDDAGSIVTVTLVLHRKDAYRRR